MIAPDSSVVIAALAPWHVAHSEAREALAEVNVGLVAHVAYETTAALGRMPEGRRIGPDVVLEALGRRFRSEWLALSGLEARSALIRAVTAGVRRGRCTTRSSPPPPTNTKRASSAPTGEPSRPTTR